MKRKAIILLTAFAALAVLSGPIQALDGVPEVIRLSQGGQTRIHTGALEVQISQEGSRAVLSSRDETLEGKGFLLTGENTGQARLVVKFLGLPVKMVNVDVSPRRSVTPGGQSIGVAMNMAGVLVVGASDVGSHPSPARLAGLRPGDLILSVNGSAITTAQQLSDCLEAGNPARLLISRSGRTLDFQVQPVQDERDGAFRLGAWVRDSTAGVGTLSYYDPQGQVFAALGHGITDGDTGSLLTLSEGAVYRSRVVGVLKGQEDAPGELLGEFMAQPEKMGSVKVNCDYGVYGKADGPLVNPLYPQGVEVLACSEVQPGPARLLTTLDEKGIKAYDCEIVKLYRQDRAGQRGMVVKITDEQLLERTGGIVQGMSGSPIIQNGRLAGVVTHVFLGDSTQGYGMYAQWMLDQSDALRQAA